MTYRGYMRTLKELNDSESVYTRSSSYVCTAKGSAGMRSNDAMTFVCVERSEKMSLLKSIFHRSVSPQQRNMFESAETGVQAGLRELRAEYDEQALKNTDSPGSSADTTTADSGSSHGRRASSQTRLSGFGLPAKHRDKVPAPPTLEEMRERSAGLIAAEVTPEEMDEYRRIDTLSDETQFRAIKAGVRTRLMRQQGPKDGLYDANEWRSLASPLTGHVFGTHQTLADSELPPPMPSGNGQASPRKGRTHVGRKEGQEPPRKGGQAGGQAGGHAGGQAGGHAGGQAGGQISARKWKSRAKFNPTAFSTAVAAMPDDVSRLQATHRCSVSSTATLEDDAFDPHSLTAGPCPMRLLDYDPSRGVSAYKKPRAIPLEVSVTADGAQSVFQSPYQSAYQSPLIGTARGGAGSARAAGSGSTTVTGLDNSGIFTDPDPNDSFFRKLVHRDRSEKPKVERIVGCVTYAPYESGWAVVSECNEVEIRLLCVTAMRGVAGLLLDHCVRIADEEKRSNVHVLVGAANKAAHLLYVRHGFRRNAKLDKVDPKTQQELKCFSFPLGHAVPLELQDIKPVVADPETTPKSPHRVRAIQHLNGVMPKRRALAVQQLDFKSEFVVFKGV
ncbi:GNAT family acetyltransferase [Gregarina niphandrodes]|uniref:GNAT family acetyltransferase n=1 Tax=Gregarina niphandrodes TaxID=110365 RepID=A0A023AXA7_GRENI|nr:GNAT family acetyltransferase [Gregarina niphandrodes]EZG43344.1 GNAT family acetyltransferase [Gregarina niphandrodes]|eukprot:XP_011133393.1 GNAT family acetyltransferase [Gregarina niphandrodes]